jgi:hypothetical protein
VMKNKILLILLALSLAVTACNLPSIKSKRDIPLPTPTPDDGWVWYAGDGIRISLPKSYNQRDIALDLPAIIETIKTFFGDNSNTLTSLIDDLEGNVAWWGYDAEAPAIAPTRLLVLHNSKLAGTPLSMLSTMVKMLGDKDAESIESRSLELGGRDLVVFSQSTQTSAWVAYTFKENGYLWVVVFMTTPANLAAQQANFERSAASIQITAQTPTEQP